MADLNAFTSAGTKLYVSTGHPTTRDAAGFAALTWTEVAGVLTIPEHGTTYEAVTVAPLGSRDTIVLKGGRSHGAPTINCALSSAGAVIDPGQAILDAEIDTDNLLSFKEEYNDNPGGTSNTIVYFESRLFSRTPNVGTRTAAASVNYALNISLQAVVVPAVA